MKINLCYPKIPRTGKLPRSPVGDPCVGFLKYDGTNTHWMWSRGDGFTSFGTRRSRWPLTSDGMMSFGRYHGNDLLYGPALFFDRHLHPAERVIETLPYDRVTLYAEYVGPDSFNGQHKPDPKDRYGGMSLILFDIEVDGHLLPPDEFLDLATKLWPPNAVAKVLYRGKYTGHVGQQVHNATLPGFPPGAEGVVFKGTRQPWMAKAKSEAWETRAKAPKK